MSETATANAAKVKPTRAERGILNRALRTSDGNPWPLIGMRQRTGGAMARMFTRMQQRGWFDTANRLTAEGRQIAEGKAPL